MIKWCVRSLYKGKATKKPTISMIPETTVLHEITHEKKTLKTCP